MAPLDKELGLKSKSIREKNITAGDFNFKSNLNLDKEVPKSKVVKHLPIDSLHNSISLENRMLPCRHNRTESIYFKPTEFRTTIEGYDRFSEKQFNGLQNASFAEPMQPRNTFYPELSSNFKKV